MEKEKYISDDYILNVFKNSNKFISISIYKGNKLKHQKAFNITKPQQLKELQYIVTLFKKGYIIHISEFHKIL